MSDTLLRKNSKEHLTPKQPPIKFKTSFKNCVLKALKNRHWKDADDDNDWDIYWGEKEAIQEVLDKTHLGVNQKVNHFRNHFELTKKDHLMRNLKKYKRQLEKDGKIEEALSYDFFPMTYNLPLEYPMFCDEFKRNGNGVWIMKPIGKSQGKGIFLFNKLSEISNWKLENRWNSDSKVEDYVVQKYISNPLLIGGKKFDLRIYCLVTSYAPLTVYLYRDGFARFTHHRYTNQDLSNTYVHLTNVAIQKTSENYDKNLGGKWELTKLKQYLISKYGKDRIDECFLKIQQLVLQTIQSVQKLIINDKHCFELYGFDVLLDQNLKPWLLEVNGSPSMTANTAQDAKLKCELLNDVFTIIDLEKRLTGNEEKVGGFDLISKPSSVKQAQSLMIDSTMLGSLTDTNQIFNMLIKEMALHNLHFPKHSRPKNGRLLTTPSAKERPLLTSSDDKSKENEQIPRMPKTSSTDNIFLTPQAARKKVFLFDSAAIKACVTSSSPNDQSLSLTSRPKRTSNRIPEQPYASMAQLKEIMNDVKLISQTKIAQAKPSPVATSQLHIMPLPFVNLTKAQANNLEDPRSLLPKKLHQTVTSGTHENFKPLIAIRIKLVTQSEKKGLKEGARRESITEKKSPVPVQRPSTTLNSSGNSRDLPGFQTSTNGFDLFNATLKMGKTLADSIMIKKVKCEEKGKEEGEEKREDKENKPLVPAPPKNEGKRAVKTCRIKIWSNKLNLQKKEENDEKSEEIKKGGSLKSSEVFKERKTEVNM